MPRIVFTPNRYARLKFPVLGFEEKAYFSDSAACPSCLLHDLLGTAAFATYIYRPRQLPPRPAAGETAEAYIIENPSEPDPAKRRRRSIGVIAVDP